jgi:hypothetical protein
VPSICYAKFVFGQGGQIWAAMAGRHPAPNRPVIQSRGAAAELLVTSTVPPAPRADLDLLRFRLGAYSHLSLLMSLLRLAAAPSPSHSGAARCRVTLRLDARRCPPLRFNPRPRRLDAAWERRLRLAGNLTRSAGEPPPEPVCARCRGAPLHSASTTSSFIHLSMGR